MRYLNKIVFINSAAIRYSEVQLDGNIHLIGTQGVGKSTILLLQRRYAAARNPGREEVVSGLLFPLCRFLDHLRGSEGGWLVYGT
ncbi:hypothetical protein PN622_00535 [Parabacteroides distasonis]|uniref:hypothetical protein n=1 Tax=Parabacteroides distasonis TaxID=823 RepID=UPI001E316D92|nr:hypothetical protein [Parabacteroides distasonis]MDB9045058.1 hypothetical protein [Parabacteroides distasonis]